MEKVFKKNFRENCKVTIETIFGLGTFTKFNFWKTFYFNFNLKTCCNKNWTSSHHTYTIKETANKQY